MTHQQILEFLKELRNANPVIEDIFLAGSCTNLYFILKSICPDASAYFNGDHVITKINYRYYDITGEVDNDDYVPLIAVYSDKYHNDESIKSGPMYNPEAKPKYTKEQ